MRSGNEARRTLEAGGQEEKAAVEAVKRQRRRSWRSGGLHEPFMSHEILKENHTSTTLQQYREVAT